MPRDHLRVRPRDAAGVGREALCRDRAEVLAVRVQQVLPADMPRRVEEGEADPDGHHKEAGTLAARHLAEAVEDTRELRRRRERGDVPSHVGKRAAQRGHLERRDVDQSRTRSREALERTEELVDRPRPRFLGERPGADELGDERVEIDTRAVRHVRGCREHPER